VAARLGGFASGRVAWISLGTFRYPPGLKQHIGSPELLAAELVPCRDGKYRYLQPVRSRLYRGLVEELARQVESPVYLCMESPAVWRSVFGRLPRETPCLRDIFEPVHGGPR
jgi:spore photoproduct lyase